MRFLLRDLLIQITNQEALSSIQKGLRSALDCVVREKDKEKVENLLKIGVPIQPLTDETSKNPLAATDQDFLLCALNNQDPQVLELLLQAGADPYPYLLQAKINQKFHFYWPLELIQIIH